MRRLAIILTAVVAMACGAMQAQTAPAADLTALKARQKDLERQRAALNDQLRQIREAMFLQADLAAQRRALDEARAKLDAKSAADANVQAARKAADQVEKDYRQIVEQTLSVHPDVSALAKDLADTEEALEDVNSDIRVATCILDEVRKKAQRSGDLRPLREAVRSADRALVDSPQVTEARRIVDEARRSCDPNAMTDADRQRIAKAQQDYEAIMKSDAVAAMQKARQDAWDAYNKAVDEKLKSDPRALQQQKDIAQHQAKVKELQDSVKAKQVKLRDLRGRLEAKDPTIAKARQAREDAMRQWRKVLEEQTAAERTEVSAALTSQNKLLEQKMSADPKATDLRKQIDEINKQLDDVATSISNASRPTTGRS